MSELENLELQKAIHAINESILSHRIYLFGSYAQGDHKRESDLDLCILTPSMHERKIDVLRRVRKLHQSDGLRCAIEISFSDGN